MHKTNFGDKKYVQHKHKSHFVFVLHKHKFNFGIAPLSANVTQTRLFSVGVIADNCVRDATLYYLVRAVFLTHPPCFTDFLLYVRQGRSRSISCE
jgi:hypothetical protein